MKKLLAIIMAGLTAFTMLACSRQPLENAVDEGSEQEMGQDTDWEEER